MSNPQAATQSNERYTAGAGVNPGPGPPAEAPMGLSGPRGKKDLLYTREKFFVFLKTKTQMIIQSFHHSITPSVLNFPI